MPTSTDDADKDKKEKSTLESPFLDNHEPLIISKITINPRFKSDSIFHNEEISQIKPSMKPNKNELTPAFVKSPSGLSTTKVNKDSVPSIVGITGRFTPTKQSKQSEVSPVHGFNKQHEQV